MIHRAGGPKEATRSRVAASLELGAPCDPPSPGRSHSDIWMTGGTSREAEFRLAGYRTVELA